MSDIPFDLNFEAEPGIAVAVAPGIRRVLARNASPFTGKGTCSYIVGRGKVAVIDPGPDDARHINALLEAVRNETVSHVVVTHTHRDHSPAAAAIRAATGAVIVGCGPHRPSRPWAEGEEPRGESGADRDYRPDSEMLDGDTVSGPGWTLTAVATPGHTANHLAFAFTEANALFSGDHVMAWSTTIVAPPDGSMTDYKASLIRLQERSEGIYWPGHGGPVREPARFLRALLHHRLQREAAILGRIRSGDRTIADIVPRLYEGLNAALLPAAALSVFAHLEDLVARRLVVTDGPATLTARYRPGGS
ncbi:MBL fold metallo-hydrolase [Chelatococcus asaccharovorans]|uniref:Glyoxylase-like metal-dependent hydrolase (Beta-lactamase superfamily II) n=1 Tax=Chelatococcus asaccharovorans TaxID=28210 RepID=A0A2V3UD83_9HYPH|nr:MBL fold metallo-hydrolase [Chelatococcus asaccharovorans]MBS7702386.1 MBL fold metallo-hydrolase [Chelatococcus asaccharovorans]PXW56412.1 glyoxylase-like metal-dependent hydrolase (beta-lactamase superfamily II) [Chelatococcus asaccharovorans]